VDVLVAALAAGTGCGPSGDAGASADAGAPPDAAVVDAGSPLDSASVTDATTDAATAPDGGRGAVPIDCSKTPCIYVAQTAQGSDSGSSCTNAHSAAWFNNLANWGSGAGKIGPGVAVRLCGNITSTMEFQGNGTANAPVTVDGSGATLAASFTETDRSYWVVQNCTWVDGMTDDALYIEGGSFGVFTGNHVDNTLGQSIFLRQSSTAVAHDITISNSFFRTSTADLGSVQTDMFDDEGSYNVVFDGNYFEYRLEGPGDHNDIIQTYEKGGTSFGNPHDWTMRHNRFVMNCSATVRQFFMFESFGGTLDVYDNVYLQINGGVNGLSTHTNQSGLVLNFFNNTFISKNGLGNIFNLQDAGTAYIRNSIVLSPNGGSIHYGGMTVVQDHNLWFGTSWDEPSCSTEVASVCADPLFTDYANNDFSLRSGSPAIGKGANLGGNYSTYILPGATWPNPGVGQRTTSWNLGAY
jgi:hypothetical protein